MYQKMCEFLTTLTPVMGVQFVWPWGVKNRPFEQNHDLSLGTGIPCAQRGNRGPPPGGLCVQIPENVCCRYVTFLEKVGSTRCAKKCTFFRKTGFRKMCKFVHISNTPQKHRKLENRFDQFLAFFRNVRGI